MPRVCRRFALIPVFALLLSLPCFAQPAPMANWNWITSPDAGQPPDTLFFRERFRIPHAPLSAKLRIAAADSFIAYVNEGKQPIGQGAERAVIQEFDVTKDLKAGANLLAVEVSSANGKCGLLFKLTITFAAGKPVTVLSDENVRVMRRAPPVWNTLALDDTAWPTAKALGDANAGVFGRLRGASQYDPTRIVRLWNIQAHGEPDEDPYTRPRSAGDRMILSASVPAPADLDILEGCGFTLFQTDSDHLSTPEVSKDHWDFSEPNSIRKAVAVHDLDWAYSPHFAFPPPWYRQTVPFTRIQCLEHQLPVEAFSPWDPAWPNFIDRGYSAISSVFAPRAPGKVKLSALYVGIHGDYGEAGLLSGARVEVPSQREDWRRRFGNVHDHLGWWCNDPLARADFRTRMLKKYGSLTALNAAWKRAYKSDAEIAYPDEPRSEAKREWVDFVSWYQNAVGNAIDFNLTSARKHFPDTLLMLPAGFSDEDLRGGNDNSLIPKIAAKYKADVRSTHAAFKPFAENSATMMGRLASASRFYGAPFWTEPAGVLTEDQEVERLFEAISEGAKGIYDWAGNVAANRDVYYRYGRLLQVEKPVVDVAMLYPAVAQRLRPDMPFATVFAQGCSYLRDELNFDIVDDKMIQDGCLAPYRILAMWEGTVYEQATLDKIKQWVNDGGVLLAYDFGKVSNVEGDGAWFNDLFGYAQQLEPLHAVEKYVGKLPAQYRIPVGLPEAADYLTGDWFEPEKINDQPRRWAGANASIKLPLDPDKRYAVVIRASVPAEAVKLKREALINGISIGDLDSSGDVTYRLRVSQEAIADRPISTLTFRSETFQPSKLIPGASDERNLGVCIHSVQVIEASAEEQIDAGLPPGQIRRELDLRKLSTDWARRYGKGLTVYFPATRQLLRGYEEIVRRLTYNLSDLYPGHRDAIAIDTEEDGVFATLFSDRILLYNARDSSVTRSITIPPAAFLAWKGVVATPTENSWKITLDPHGIGAIYLTPNPIELLFECEKFTDLGDAKLISSPDCSPGSGSTSVRLADGAAIATRFTIETPGQYSLFVRAVRNATPEPVDALIDDQPVPAVNTRSGQTLLVGALPLTKGAHTLTLRARPNRDVRADFVVLTTDTTIAGYTFAIRSVSAD